MSLTPEQERQFKLGWQAVELGVISADCLVKSLYVWLSDESSSLAEVVLAQSGLTDQSRDTLQQIFSSIMARSEETLAPTEHQLDEHSPADAMRGSTVTEDFRLNDRHLDIIQNLIGDMSGLRPEDHEEATIAYVPLPGTPVEENLDQQIEEARKSEQGRFRIEKELNKGGLGVVYAGTDLQLNRQVAIKKIRDSKASSAYTREKFLLEAEVTGQLEHPGIVPIYALGTDGQKQPYYAMRLIRGDDLASAIHRFHATQGHQPGCFDSLEFRGLLRRFIDVCYAIDYAHSRCVLHRDLKPANIMIGLHGETLVVDWGLAKVITSPSETSTEDENCQPRQKAVHVRSATDLSLIGTFAGTPRYAAPEQLAGQVDRLDARTDIYGLGAILYELLCNQPPLESGLSLKEAQHIIQSNQVRPPRSIVSTVPRALDAICRQALMAKPDDRYGSARALAEDVERWLADVRVLAYRDEPLPERIGRWLRHHRSWTIAIAVSLILVSIVTVLAASLINRARLNEQVARRSAQEFKEDAVARYRVAKNAVDLLVERADKLANVPGSADIQMSILNEAAARYAALSQSYSPDPQLEIERVRAMVRLADVQQLQLDSDAASKTYLAATELLQTALGDSATEPPRSPAARDIERAIELARTLARHGLALSESRNAKAARAKYEQALSIFQAWSPLDRANAWLAGNWAVTLARLGEEDLMDGKAQAAIANLEQSLKLFAIANGKPDSNWPVQFELSEIRAHELLGRCLRKVGQHSAARIQFQETRESLDKLLGNEPTNLRYRESRVSLLISMAESNRAYGDWNLASTQLNAARAEIDQLCTEIPGSLGFTTLQATTTLNQGIIDFELDDFQNAQKALELAAQQLTSLARGYPDIERESIRAQALCELGKVYGKAEATADNADAALEAATTLLDDYLSLYREEHQTNDWPMELIRASHRSHWAQLQMQRNDLDKARAGFAQAIEVMTHCVNEQIETLKAKSFLMHTLWNSGRLELAAGDVKTARDQLTRALELGRELVAADATPLNQYYLALFLADCPDESLQDLSQARTLAGQCCQAIPDNPKFAELRERLQ